MRWPRVSEMSSPFWTRSGSSVRISSAPHAFYEADDLLLPHILELLRSVPLQQ